MKPPPLHCDVCGCVLDGWDHFTCEVCNFDGKEPTKKSLDRATVLNAPYWRWKADDDEWKRTIFDQGFEEASDGSIVWIEGYKQRERWKREKDVHRGPPLHEDLNRSERWGL